MFQILQKSPPALDIRAGSTAARLIQQNGLYAEHVDVIPGAAGGPKGLGLQGLDRAIFTDFLPQSPRRRTLIGSSIGSWRFASILAWGAQEGTERLAELYTQLDFPVKAKRQEISQICAQMLTDLLADRADQLLQHPDYHLTVISAKARHLFQSDQNLALLTSIAGIVGSNAVARKHCQHFMQRVISQPAHEQQFRLTPDDFETHYQTLNHDNLQAWLMASASIPGVMNAVRHIPGAPAGSYRDGGLIDYHLDLDFHSQGIVLYPHFSTQIVPGWFDKMWKSRQANPNHHARTLLLSPSAVYLKQLPLGRLPDRKDFTQKGLTRQKRIQLWKQCIAESQRMGDEFLQLQHQQKFAEQLQAL